MPTEIKNRFTGAVICTGETVREAALANLANLRYADLRYANLRYANLRYANLRYANLSYADLRYADLSYANLSYANLRDAKIAWQSHDLLAELLRRAAGDEIEKRKVAGLLLVSRDKCWKEFIAMRDREPLFDWAIEELAKWVQLDDEAPEILRELVTTGD